MRGWTFVAGALIAGCSGGANQSEPGAKPTNGGPCATRVGTYVTQFTARTGDCGEMAETIDTVNGEPSMPQKPCTGMLHYTADLCAVTGDVTCPLPGITGSTEVKTSSTWSPDASKASGIAEVTVYNADGTVMCHGTYDVTVTRR
jgi:hypothetical protein